MVTAILDGMHMECTAQAMHQNTRPVTLEKILAWKTHPSKCEKVTLFMVQNFHGKIPCAVWNENSGEGDAVECLQESWLATA